MNFSKSLLRSGKFDLEGVGVNVRPFMRISISFKESSNDEKLMTLTLLVFIPLGGMEADSVKNSGCLMQWAD